MNLRKYGGIIKTNFNGPLELGSDLGKVGYGTSGPWHDWWIVHILLREAGALIEGQTDAPATDANTRAN